MIFRDWYCVHSVPFYLSRNCAIRGWKVFKVEFLSGLSPFRVESQSGLSPFGVESQSRLSPFRVESIRGLSPYGVKSIWDWVHLGLSPFGMQSIRGLSLFGGWAHSGVESIRGLRPFGGWVHSGLSPFGISVHSGLGPFRDQPIRGWVFLGSVVVGSVGDSVEMSWIWRRCLCSGIGRDDSVIRVKEETASQKFLQFLIVILLGKSHQILNFVLDFVKIRWVLFAELIVLKFLMS
jgi:hypothetical protein